MSARPATEAEERYVSGLLRSYLDLPDTPARARTADRVLRTHALRAADAFQLAAAIVAADGEPRSLTFVTLDARLALAAGREGFPVIEPA